MNTQYLISGLIALFIFAACSKDDTSYEIRPDEPTLIIKNGAFSEQTIVVPAGARVSWVNHDHEKHGVIDEQGKFHVSLDSGYVFTFQYEELGNHNYRCPYHPDQRASVLVVER